MDPTHEALESVGPRLRALRQERGLTLAELSEGTGISVSTLSRLEAGQRKPTLELLLPIARVHQVQLDELVGEPPAEDPRVQLKPIRYGDMTMVPLTRRPGGLQAFKSTIPPGKARRTPDPKSHEGYDWLYVLSGRLRMVLGEHDLVLEPGEAAEFDTRVPHWFGGADERAVEFLTIFSREGERIHVRARSTDSSGR
jgi:transcriptional regulator with XRE-family HTH domain